jgi:hypothetical protein
MPSPVQLKLGGPLFVTALIIANAQWNSVVECVGVEPPRVQSVLSFTAFNATRASGPGWKRTAMAAVRIAASFFQSAGIAPPAGICPDRQGAGCLRKLPAWLGQLAALRPAEALRLLAEHLQHVPEKVWTQVEAEYNAGVKAAGLPGLALLKAGSLASRAACLLPAHCEAINVHYAAVSAGTAAPKGRFFYIAAGVGCGIKEIQEVCTTATI